MKEMLDVSGEVLLRFRLEIEGGKDNRAVANEDLEELITNNIIESLEDLGLSIEFNRMYNFDVYEVECED